MLKQSIVTGKKLLLLLIQPDHREKLRTYAQDDRIWNLSTYIAHYGHDLFNTWFTLTYNNANRKLNEKISSLSQ
jgi:hypothetical protein